jgi:DNA-binding transcriptional regulator PaaX
MEKQRQIFRRKLKNIGCYMIQKSVFVFPYSCEEEISYCCTDLGLGGYVDVITTDAIGSKEPAVKKYFDL